MNPYLTKINRAILLMQQHRPEMAEEVLRSAIADEPDISDAYALLGLICADDKRFDEATQLVQRAVSLSPGEDQPHYASAYVDFRRGKLKEASASIDTAIEIDPTDADYYALKASIELQRYQWKEAVEAAERGLEFDPENISCANNRAIALTKLGRRDEAGVTMERALAKNPEDSYSHANMGWTKLHAGEPQAAAVHFREALRLDPNNGWARQGIVEALKARNFLYRWFLGFILWLSSFSPKTQIMLFIGVIVGLQIMLRLPEGPLQTFGLLLAMIYGGFVICVWMADPLFNMLLSLTSDGRLFLTDDQKSDTKWTLAAIAVSGFLISQPLLTGFRTSHVIDYLMTMIAAGVALNVPRSSNRKLAATLALGVFGLAMLHCYRWYFAELPIDVRNLSFEEIQNTVNELGEANPRVLGLLDLLDRQEQVRNLFVWGTVAMTWFSGFFRGAR